MSTSFLGRFTAIVIVMLMATCVAPSGAQEASKPQPPKAKTGDELIASLNDLIRSYAADNAALRARVKDLESQVAALKRTRTVTVVPPQPGKNRQVPPDWKEVPFNGGVYYIVPLEQSADAPKAVKPAPPAPQPK
jgi:hypothetical protein